MFSKTILSTLAISVMLCTSQTQAMQSDPIPDPRPQVTLDAVAPTPLSRLASAVHRLDSWGTQNRYFTGTVDEKGLSALNKARGDFSANNDLLKDINVLEGIIILDGENPGASLVPTLYGWIVILDGLDALTENVKKQIDSFITKQKQLFDAEKRSFGERTNQDILGGVVVTNRDGLHSIATIGMEWQSKTQGVQEFLRTLQGRSVVVVDSTPNESADKPNIKIPENLFDRVEAAVGKERVTKLYPPRGKSYRAGFGFRQIYNGEFKAGFASLWQAIAG